MRPPTRGKPSLARSTTRGASGMRPLNQGLTVCWSEEPTSTGWVAISARTWLATTMSASGGPGDSANQVAPLPMNAATATEAASARRRRPQADGGFDPARETGRRAFARQLLGDDAPQRLHPLAFDRQRRIVGELALDLQRVGRVELAVHIGVDEQARIRRCHVAPPGLSVPMRSISRRRARASRDITVPMGTLVTSEISR